MRAKKGFWSGKFRGTKGKIGNEFMKYAGFMEDLFERASQLEVDFYLIN